MVGQYDTGKTYNIAANHCSLYILYNLCSIVDTFINLWSVNVIYILNS